MLLVGTNPRYEAPLLNTRIRKGYVHGECDIGLIGPSVDLSYKYEHLGEQPQVIADIVAGKHPFAKKLAAAKKPVIIVGADQLARKDGAAILGKLYDYAESLNKDVSFA